MFTGLSWPWAAVPGLFALLLLAVLILLAVLLGRQKKQQRVLDEKLLRDNPPWAANSRRSGQRRCRCSPMTSSEGS